MTAAATSGLVGLIVPARPAPAAAAPSAPLSENPTWPYTDALAIELANGEVIALVTPASTAFPGKRRSGAVSPGSASPAASRPIRPSGVCEVNRLTPWPTGRPSAPPAAPPTAAAPDCRRSNPSRVPCAIW